MNVLHAFLVYSVWFLATYYLVFLILVLCTHESRLSEKRKLRGPHPKVSIIVPAYNEEGKIAQTIRSLQKVTYDRIEFIVVNDGSRDGTSAEVRAAIKGDRRFRFIDRKENRGKAASLNEGIDVANGEYIVTIDADTVIEKDIIQKVIPYFDEQEVGAVTVSVQVKKPKGVLQRMLQIEYIIGLSLFLRLLSFVDLVFVTPGPFSIYRRSLLKQIGGFDVKNITEDLEIAYRIRLAGYRIANCMDAKVYTILPETFKGLYVQRKRWYTGALLTVIQHRKSIFSRRMGIFGPFIIFTYSLTVLGILLFLSTLWLTVSTFVMDAWQFQYTGFNYWDNFLNGIREWHFDILRYSGIDLIAMTSLVLTFLILGLGLLATETRARDKKIGILGYPFLFFLYQLWWISSLWATLTGKKVKWR